MLTEAIYLCYEIPMSIFTEIKRQTNIKIKMKIQRNLDNQGNPRQKEYEQSYPV